MGLKNMSKLIILEYRMVKITKENELLKDELKNIHPINIFVRKRMEKRIKRNIDLIDKLTKEYKIIESIWLQENY